MCACIYVCMYVKVCICVYLHGVRNVLPVRQDLTQVLGTEDVPERGGCQEPRGAVRVLHVGDGHGGVLHAVVDHCVNCHCHRVTGQHLGGGHRRHRLMSVHRYYDEKIEIENLYLY